MSDDISIRIALPALLPALRAYGRTLARNTSAADDLVQEALWRALRSEEQFHPGTDLRAWVFSILRNVWLGQLRLDGRERRAMAGRDIEKSIQADQTDRMELSNLSRAMETLPVSYREALMLVGAHGMTNAQAAAVVGVAEGTIKARVSRARASLRALLPRGEDNTDTNE